MSEDITLKLSTFELVRLINMVSASVTDGNLEDADLLTKLCDLHIKHVASK